MVFVVYKKIKEKLSSFKYNSNNLISLLVIKICQISINKKVKEIDEKIIDFIKYK